MRLSAPAFVAAFLCLSPALADDAGECRAIETVINEMEGYGAAQTIRQGSDYADRYRLVIQNFTDREIKDAAEGIGYWKFPNGKVIVAMTRGVEFCYPLVFSPDIAGTILQFLEGPGA